MTIDATPNPESELPARDLRPGDTFRLGAPDGALVEVLRAYRVTATTPPIELAIRREGSARVANITTTARDALGIFEHRKAAE